MGWKSPRRLRLTVSDPHPLANAFIEASGGADDAAVINERLRVRASDASIMPTMVWGKHRRARHHDRREGRGHDSGDGR